MCSRDLSALQATSLKTEHRTYDAVRHMSEKNLYFFPAVVNVDLKIFHNHRSCEMDQSKQNSPMTNGSVYSLTAPNRVRCIAKCLPGSIFGRTLFVLD